MRIAAFDDARIGVVANDDTVVDVTDLLQPYEPLGPEDLLPDLITHFDDLRPELERRAAAGRRQAARRGATPFAADPAVEDHLPDGQLSRGHRPARCRFSISSSSRRRRFPGPGDTVVLPPHQANIFHHEGEIAVVIGREAKDLSADGGDGRGLRLRRLQRCLRPRTGAHRHQQLPRQVVRYLRRVRPLDRHQRRDPRPAIAAASPSTSTANAARTTRPATWSGRSANC